MLRPGTFALTALLAALSAVAPLTTDMYLPSLPNIAQQLSASTAQVQLTISAYLIGFALGQIFYGPLSDRHGRKPVLLCAVALYCVASLVCALSTSVEMLIVARFAQALGGSGGVVLARAIVRDLYSGARAGRELSLIGSVTALAPVLAPVVGGILQTGFGWRSIFVTLVIAGLASGGMVWLRLPETLATRAAEPVSPVNMLKSYRVVARHPAFLAYLGISTASYAGLFAWISGASFVLQNLYGLTPFNFGIGPFSGAVGSRWHYRARQRRRQYWRAWHGGGGCARLDVRDLTGVAGCGLSRRSRHGVAANHRRRHDAVSRTRGHGLRSARLHSAKCGGLMRRGGRLAVGRQCLADSHRRGGHGLHDIGDMAIDAPLARALRGHALDERR